MDKNRLILFIVIFLSLCGYAEGTTVAVETDAELNEGHKEHDLYWNPGDGANFIGVIGSYYLFFNFWHDNYVRFANITVPKKATIVSTYIQFYGADFSPTSAGTAVGTIYGIDEDNTANFSSDPSGRSLTTASVAYSFTGWTQATATAASKTDDIKTIVQEIVDRDGWASGNAIGFKFDTTSKSGDNYAYWAPNDDVYGGADLDPELTIVWKYRDSGIRIYSSGGTISIGMTETDDSPLMFRKGATTVGIPLVATGANNASSLRIYDGSNVKALGNLD